jgi:hypothetical protein
VGPKAPRSGSPAPGSGGWSPPLFSGRPASGRLVVLGPTRLKRSTLDGRNENMTDESGSHGSGCEDPPDLPEHIREAHAALIADDFGEVERLLLDRAIGGEIDAQALMGTAIMLLRPERRDDATSLLRRAMDAGSGSAAHNLGTLYLTGPHADRATAKACYRRAYDLGFEQTVSSDPLWWEKIRG